MADTQCFDKGGFWSYLTDKCISQEDVVNHPKHYTFGGVEVIDALEAWELNFRLANAVKYIARHKHKGGLEDLKKARWYLEREIVKQEAAEKQGVSKLDEALTNRGYCHGVDCD